MERDYWIDQAKVIACFGVTYVHLVESMLKSDITPVLFHYRWIILTGHMTFVQLFFICSGYLYQKYSHVTSLKEWKTNVIKKMIMLGIPYFIFSTATWILKNISEQYINEKPDGLFESLFIRPIGQYWFLYTLFFLFIITPTFKSKKAAFSATGISILLRILSILSGDLIKIHIIGSVLENIYLFDAGMLISMYTFNVERKRIMAAIPGCLYLVISLFAIGKGNRFVNLGMEILACSTILIMFYKKDKIKWMDIMSQYTMAIFLMHTMFASVTRMILLKSGVENIHIHLLSGTILSIAGPIIAMKVLRIMKLDFIVNPKPILGHVFKQR